MLGWFFIASGVLFFLAGLAMAICILLAGRSFSRRCHYWFVFVVACIECVFMPFGTILGVFTIIVLSRESVKALFSTAMMSRRRAETKHRRQVDAPAQAQLPSSPQKEC